MGFRYDTSKHRDKNAIQKASFFGMIMVFVILAFSIWFGWWLPDHFPVRAYLPILATWPNLAISILGGLAAFILLQFLVSLISGILFPPPPKDKYDQDGMYKRE